VSLARESLPEKKRRWFAAGAADFAVSLPNAIKELGETEEIYCCPLCARADFLKVFKVTALARGTLTAEDVPPRHSGGRPLVLTCKSCNNTAGHGIDAAALEVENGRRFLQGRGEGVVRIAAGPYQLGATLRWREDGGGTFRLFRNRDVAFSELRSITDGSSRDRSIRFKFSVRDPDDHFARVSWLKSGFLAMFALFGYRYALHPITEVVRRQIQDPNVEHIRTFSIRLTEERAFSECRTFAIRIPDFPLCWGIQMGPYVVFLPGDTSEQLYPTLERLREEKQSFNFTATDTVWPTQPVFSLAHRFR